ncbi:EamA family transporter [Candidatus Bathyarchaeota archaeon]|nr:EamA family transporter [Candidatus Bathyarchaeota archaeon]
MKLGLRSVGCLAVAIASVIWGSNGVIVNHVFLPSYTIAFFRVSFATLSLWLGALFTRKWRVMRVRGAWRSLVVLGLLLALGWAFLFQAMKLIPIGNAVLLNYTAPVFVALLAPIILKERVRQATLYGLTLSVAGILLISLTQDFQIHNLSLLGVISALSAGFVYALFVIFAKKTLANLSGYSVALYSYFFSSVFLVPSLIQVDLSISLNSWLLLLFLGVFNTAFAVTLYLRGLHLIKAQEAAVLTYFEPASAVGFGFLLLAQQPTPTMIVGGLLILSAGYIVASKTEEEAPKARLAPRMGTKKTNPTR